MPKPTPASDLVSTLRNCASRVGHDVVWLGIAGLFCVVEGVVFVSEHVPVRLLRRASKAVPAKPHRYVGASPTSERALAA